jgi:hypothetical protein
MGPDPTVVSPAAICGKIMSAGESGSQDWMPPAHCGRAGLLKRTVLSNSARALGRGSRPKAASKWRWIFTVMGSLIENTPLLAVHTRSSGLKWRLVTRLLGMGQMARIQRPGRRVHDRNRPFASPSHFRRRDNLARLAAESRRDATIGPRPTAWCGLGSHQRRLRSGSRDIPPGSACGLRTQT